MIGVTDQATGASFASVVVGVLVFAVGMAMYVAPSAIAVRRRHHQTAAIVAVNVLGGLFCGLGWVVALVWALTATPGSQQARPGQC